MSGVALPTRNGNGAGSGSRFPVLWTKPLCRGAKAIGSRALDGGAPPPMAPPEPQPARRPARTTTDGGLLLPTALVGRLGR